MKLEELIRRVNVRTRLLAALLFVSIIPTILVGVYAYRAYAGSITQRLTDMSILSVQQLGTVLSAELSRYSQWIDVSSVSTDVQEALSERESGGNLRRAVSNIIIVGGYFRGLRIAGTNGEILFDDGRLRLLESGFIRLLDDAEAASPMDSLQYIGGYPAGSIAIGRKIHRYPRGVEHIGYIFAIVDPELLKERIFSGTNLGGEMILMAADGTVLSASVTEAGTPLRDTQLYSALMESSGSGGDIFTVNWNGIQSFAVFSAIPRYNAYLIATIPLSYIDSEMRPVLLRILLLTAVAIVLSVVLSLLIYRSVDYPIRRIIGNLSDGEAGPVMDENPDELGFLARAIDKYTVELESMALMRMEDQRRKRELELAALQYQINPHFLFNTLGTLKWLAVINDAPAVISDGITSLSQLLRGILLSDDELVSVREELDNLSHYLAIQRIRYADCFNVVEEIDETVLSCPIPRFILQPLVENSVLHGSESGRRITVTISCRRQDECVLLEISDDGNGFDIESVNKHSHKKFSGIGISNVDERLKLYYGDEHGLEIYSKPGEGTICRVIIPESKQETGPSQGGGSDV